MGFYFIVFRVVVVVLVSGSDANAVAGTLVLF